MLYYNYFSSTIVVANQNNSVNIFIQIVSAMFWQHFIYLPTNYVLDQNYLSKNK